MISLTPLDCWLKLCTTYCENLWHRGQLKTAISLKHFLVPFHRLGKQARNRSEGLSCESATPKCHKPLSLFIHRHDLQTADREHGCALLPSESFHSVLSVVIDTHHQLVWIWNQHGDKCLHVLVRRLLGGANCGGKSHPKHWLHQSMVCAGLNKRRKPVGEQPSFFSICWLWLIPCEQLTFLPPCHPHHNGLHPSMATKTNLPT